MSNADLITRLRKWLPLGPCMNLLQGQALFKDVRKAADALEADAEILEIRLDEIRKRCKTIHKQQTEIEQWENRGYRCMQMLMPGLEDSLSGNAAGHPWIRTRD